MRVAVRIVMRWWLACVATVGCTEPLLTVEPASIDLDVDLAQVAPSVRLQVLEDGRDVTGEATFVLEGTPVGTLAGPQLSSDGRTGQRTAVGDQLPRWASAVAGGRAGLRDPEPMVWIAFASARAVGASPLPAGSKSLWLAAFYPARGVLTRPFHLPGQARTLFALHSPSALP